MSADTMTKDQTIALQAAEIEKLGSQLAGIERGYKGFRDTAEAEYARLHAEIKKLREEGKKDYDGMREFQRKFIDADHEVRRLRALLRDILADQQTAHWHEDIKEALGE